MAAPNNQISINVWLSPNEGPEKEGGVGGSRASSSRDPWLSSVMTDEGESGENKCQQFKIQHVSAMLRDVESNKKCFDPLVVSIGPYHHGKPELQSMERLKSAMARQHVTESKVEIQDLYNKVVEVVGEARKCYIEGSTDEFDDREFAQMMFLDGCFILQFIKSSVENKPNHVNMKSHNVAFVRRDLILLENQLPFLVLEALMLEEKETWLQKINKFIERSRARSPHHQKGEGWFDGIKKLFHHNGEYPQVTQEQQQHVHLLGILHSQLINHSALDSISCTVSDWSSYRSAKELKAAGIQFKPSKSDSFTDVNFESGLSFGTLKLPPMMVDDNTKSVLLNLVAYESCPGGPDDFGVTSYLSFMDVLIDHAEDVKELRSNGILFNILGSDQEVADLFNEIAKDLVPNPHAYAKVKGNIERHYNNKGKIWIAEWLHTHFSSPWTFLAFLAAVFALALSGIQTYYAAFSGDEKKPN